MKPKRKKKDVSVVGEEGREREKDSADKSRFFFYFCAVWLSTKGFEEEKEKKTEGKDPYFDSAQNYVPSHNSAMRRQINRLFF